ncbi:hypothetical protein RCL1_004622 [Eukaryota sp. TZLM3-RCL]
MDTIESSNLNRQFLFSPEDVGRSKAKAAADTLQRRFNLTVTAYDCKIQDLDIEFYTQFNVIIAGLDSVEARRFLNRTVVNIRNSFGIVIPLIDGGSEGLNGTYRAIVPGFTGCMECFNLFAEVARFPVCTLANRPRAPEHCIEYALFHLWPSKHEGVEFDIDNLNHVELLLKDAIDHGKQFNISGISTTLLSSVVRNVIPAVASTNAFVANVCVFEAVKIVTCIYELVDSFGMYNCTNSFNGIYSMVIPVDKRPDCAVCAYYSKEMTLSGQKSISNLIEELKNGLIDGLELSNLVVTINSCIIYSDAASMKNLVEDNLTKNLNELFIQYGEGLSLDISDPKLSHYPIPLHLLIDLE